MLAVWIAAAFGLGLLARLVGLPPLVGFLATGFLLNAAGVEHAPLLEDIAELGVLLLLFSVGLKLRIASLLRGEVWGGALLHLLAVALVTGLLLTEAGIGSTTVLLELAGAAAFSSTILAAKILEERREIRAFHGRVAIGILVVQDLVAVALLSFSGGRVVTPWAGLVLLAPLFQPLLGRLVDRAGHGELLVLLGGVLALAVGGVGFTAIGLSPELGALLVGMLLAGHPRAVELGDALWGMKEFFLVGFFVMIGVTDVPTWHTFELAAIPVLLLPLKVGLYFLLLLVFGLSARTAFLTGLSLGTYSEFGLIVVAAAAKQGMIPAEWVVVTAIAVAGSFALMAPLNRHAHDAFALLERFLRPLERRRRHPDDEPVSIGQAEVVVVGMGRVGTGAYDHARTLGRRVVGLDSDLDKVRRHIEAGRRVAYADAEDPSLWHRLNLDGVQVIMLAVPDLEAKVQASEQLRRRRYAGLISATFVWPEERAPILAAGADVTYNYFEEAGVGLASDSFAALQADDGPARGA